MKAGRQLIMVGNSTRDNATTHFSESVCVNEELKAELDNFDQSTSLCFMLTDLKRAHSC